MLHHIMRNHKLACPSPGSNNFACPPSAARPCARTRPVPGRWLSCSHAFAVVLVSLLAAFLAPAQTDDFNDANDAGWSRVAPLAGLGVGGAGTWTFPNGAYRIQAAPSLVPNPYGPGRAGSFRSGVNLSRFYMAVDVVAWDNSLDQIMGILARVSNLGLGQTRGYAFTYATRAGRNPTGQLEILRIANESGTTISGASLDFTLLPGAQYRFVFSGVGSSLVGQVFSLTNLVVPLASVVGTDSSYTSGGVGLFIYDNSPSSMNAADVTFDNFLAAPSAPPPITISADNLGQLTLSWPLSAEGYRLERSPSLTTPDWRTISNFDISEDGNNYFYQPEHGGQAGFFRLNWP